MKARDLIEILQRNPEAEVITTNYAGWGNPIVGIDSVEEIKAGQSIKEQIGWFDGSNVGCVADDSECVTDVFFIS